MIVDADYRAVPPFDEGTTLDGEWVSTFASSGIDCDLIGIGGVQPYADASSKRYFRTHRLVGRLDGERNRRIAIGRHYVKQPAGSKRTLQAFRLSPRSDRRQR